MPHHRLTRHHPSASMFISLGGEFLFYHLKIHNGLHDFKAMKLTSPFPSSISPQTLIDRFITQLSNNIVSFSQNNKKLYVFIMRTKNCCPGEKRCNSSGSSSNLRALIERRCLARLTLNDDVVVDSTRRSYSYQKLPQLRFLKLSVLKLDGSVFGWYFGFLTHRHWFLSVAFGFFLIF